jgi:hypothetical protein
MFETAHDAAEEGKRLMPALHRSPPEEDKSPLKALREAIAEGDADLAAGRFRSYKTGDFVREMRAATTEGTHAAG